MNIIKEYKLNVKDDYLCVSHSLFCTARKVTSNIFAAVSEAAPGGILPEQVLLEISQNSQENTCDKVFFNIVAGLRPATLLKKSGLQIY